MKYRGFRSYCILGIVETGQCQVWSVSCFVTDFYRWGTASNNSFVEQRIVISFLCGQKELKM